MSISKLLVRILIAAAVCGAAYMIYRGLSQYSIDEISSSLAEIPVWRLALALAFAGCSYLCLTGFDYLGILYAGKRLAWPRVALASFCSLSIGHNIGVAALSSGAIRYRFYRRWGLDGEDVARIIALSGATVALGLATLAGISMTFYSDDAQSLLETSPALTRTIAVACLAAPVAFIAAAWFIRGKVTVWRWEVQLPEPRIAVAQVVIGTVNYVFVAACLHQLLAALEPVPYLKAAAMYSIANATALVSHVPGGLGVLEATVVYLLPGSASLAAMVAFRITYFFVPLAFGLPLFLACEYLIGSRSEAGVRPAE